jgi:hypothetical protein
MGRSRESVDAGPDEPREFRDGSRRWCLCSNVAWGIWFSHLRNGAARTLPIPKSDPSSGRWHKLTRCGERHALTMELLRLEIDIMASVEKNFIFQ